MTSDQENIAIRQAAADWLMRLQDDSAAEADWLEFDAWLSASPAHASAYDGALAVWSELGVLAPELKAAAAPVPLATRTRPSRRLIAWGIGAAAAAALAVAVMPTVLTPTKTYETGRGETRTVALSDGSTIHMNAGSRISVRITGSVRQVAMNDAQAVFDVAALAVTVRRGVVEVRPDAASQAGAVRLIQGQRLEHAAGGASLVSAVNPDDAFAWRSGRLIYRDRPLAEVVAELNRQFERDIRLADATTGRQRVSGVLVLDDEKAVIERLSLLAPVSVSTADAGFVLRSNAPSN